MKNMRYECAYVGTHKRNDNKIDQQTKKEATNNMYTNLNPFKSLKTTLLTMTADRISNFHFTYQL